VPINSSMAAPGSAYPRRSYAFFAIAVMMVATCHSQLDKQFPGLLVGPIRAAFHISDTQVSLFQGASFAVFYAVMGPIFGRMVDTRSRRNLIIFGILLWSIMTILAGFSRSYWELLATRVGVGIGEAVLMPAAFSMIADYVEPTIRGRATAIYMTSQALGTGISLLIGGAIVGAAAHAGAFANVPLLGRLASWQLAFVLVGLPGVITGLMMLTVKEPKRRLDNIKTDDAKGISAEFVAYVKRHKLAVGGVLVSQVAVNFVGNSVVPWLPTIFIRLYKVPVGQLGAILGFILFTGSATGFFLSGHLSDHWLKKGRPDARLLPLFVGYIAFIPLVTLWPLAGNLYVSYAAFWLQCVAHVMAIATMPVAMQEIVPARMRGQSVTLVILVTTLLGWAVGPTAVALCTDYVFHNDDAVPYSLVLVCVPMAVFALLSAWVGRRAFIGARTELQAAAGGG
jgi:MFS family permease